MCVASNTSIITPALAPTYIKNVPSDPKDGGDCTVGPNMLNNAYCYYPQPNLCTGASGATPCRTYAIYTCLENGGEPVNGNVSVSSACISTKLYTILSP